MNRSLGAIQSFQAGVLFEYGNLRAYSGLRFAQSVRGFREAF
jgi:hypothetical protein